MINDDGPGWSNNRRAADGAFVVETEQGHWVAVAPGRPTLAFCPCCGKPFTSARFACNAADGVYPPP